jgi:hypothetical protein
MAKLTKGDFAKLLAFRTDLRRFERWSERQARAVGISPAQHQLMLAVKGHDDRRGPTLGEAAGLVERKKTDPDGRLVRVELTADGEDRLHALSALHLGELRRMAPSLKHLVEGLDD